MMLDSTKNYDPASKVHTAFTGRPRNRCRDAGIITIGLGASVLFADLDLFQGLGRTLNVDLSNLTTISSLL